MDAVAFIKSFPVHTFQKGEIILNAAQETEQVYVIQSGAVKISSVNEDGVERLLSMAGKYDVVPAEKLFSPKVVTRYFYTAFCDVSVYVLDKKSFLEAAAKDLSILHQIARGMGDHYDDLLSRLHSVEQSTLKSKVLHMLHAFSTKFSAADVVHLHEIGLNLTHQDIADMVHATREATSIELKKLFDEGFITYDRSSFTVFVKKITQEISAPA